MTHSSPPTPSDETPNGLVDINAITPDETLLADVRRTRLTTPVTRVLLALVALGTAFLCGTLVERSLHKTSSASPNLSAIASQFRNRAAGGTGSTTPGTGTGTGTGTGVAGASGTVVGTVKLVDGNNVYVQDFSGNVVKVTTSTATSVTVSSKGTVQQLKAGTSVIVQGTPSKDGTSTAATSISQSSGLGTGSPFGRAGTGAAAGG